MAGMFTTVEAVNIILATIGHRQITTVSSESGPSDASDALRVLNRNNSVVQAQGWPANTSQGQAFLAADIGGGVFQIDLSEAGTVDVLRVECVAPGPYTGRIEIRNDAPNNRVWAYDSGGNTLDFGSAVTIYCDVVRELDFENECPIDIQDLVVRAAKQEFQMDRATNQAINESIREERARAELSANRDRGRPRTPVHGNDQPVIPGASAQR